MLVATLLLIISISAFVSKQFELFCFPLDISSEGVSLYIKQFSKFYGLFGATVTVIVAYYGIERLRAAERANYDKVKLDRYADWRLITDLRIELIKDDNPLFRREFYKMRYQLFEELYPKFEIKDYTQLNLIFDRYFKSYIPSFEKNNAAHQRSGEFYPSANHSFFGSKLDFVFLGSLQGETYENINEDFEKLYIKNLPPDRIIDARAYQLAQQRFYGNEF